MSLWKRGPRYTAEADSIEKAVHEAVERNGFRDGDHIKVIKIRGRVGPEHSSPWHITYSVIIEKEPRG